MSYPIYNSVSIFEEGPLPIQDKFKIVFVYQIRPYYEFQTSIFALHKLDHFTCKMSDTYDTVTITTLSHV